MKAFHSPPLTRRRFLRATALTTGALAGPWAHWPQVMAQGDVSAEDQRKIEAALPAQAFAEPRRPRKLLIFDLNVGYGGHGSIHTANLAFTLMGQKTGAFETVVSRDPSVFKPESLRQFDAVFFNNTVGNCFTDPALRQSLVEFVYGGGGLMGVHGTSVAFTQWPGAIEDWPEFGLMIGARGANHRASDERVFVKLDDPTHPVNQPFGGQGFEFRDEFFRVHEPYSRDRVRVLLSIDTEKTDLKQGPAYGKLERADNDFALAWVRNYGRGRTFYCTIAHNPYVFWDAKMLQFYLAATQFVLGDLEAPTLPSAKLTPAMRAQEKLGWRLAIEPTAPQEKLGSRLAIKPTAPLELNLFEAVDQAGQLGTHYLEGLSSRSLSQEIRTPIGALSSDEDFKQLRLKLDSTGMRLLAYQNVTSPTEVADWRQVFEQARRLGVEVLEPRGQYADLGHFGTLADEFGINVAVTIAIPLRPLNSSVSPVEGFLKAAEGRGARLGARLSLESWFRFGADPLPAFRQLKDRLMVVQLGDLDKKGRSVPWGSGVGNLAKCLREIHQLGIRPLIFSCPDAPAGSGSGTGFAQSIEFFNRTCLELAEENPK